MHEGKNMGIIVTLKKPTPERTGDGGGTATASDVPPRVAVSSLVPASCLIPGSGAATANGLRAASSARPHRRACRGRQPGSPVGPGPPRWARPPGDRPDRQLAGNHLGQEEAFVAGRLLDDGGRLGLPELGDQHARQGDEAEPAPPATSARRLNLVTARWGRRRCNGCVMALYSTATPPAKSRGGWRVGVQAAGGLAGRLTHVKMPL